MAAINERRKEFNQNSNQAMQSNQRYHADEVEERFAKYKPGIMRQDCFWCTTDTQIIPNLFYQVKVNVDHRLFYTVLNSEELLTALGIDGNTLPPLIYRMRQLGYPPGWLKEAEVENSGITMFDGNGMF